MSIVEQLEPVFKINKKFPSWIEFSLSFDPLCQSLEDIVSVLRHFAKASIQPL